MDGNLHSYRAIGHQHNGEIGQECQLQLAPNTSAFDSFHPFAPLVRGIHTTITATLRDGVRMADAQGAWTGQLRQSAICPGTLKHAVKSKSATWRTPTLMTSQSKQMVTKLLSPVLLITLLKGASGQAVQSQYHV